MPRRRPDRHAHQGDAGHLVGSVVEQGLGRARLAHAGQARGTQEAIGAFFGQGAPAGRHAAGPFDGDHAGHQAKAQAGGLVHPAGQVGVVARFQQVDDRGVGLGLGGEVGSSRRLDAGAGDLFAGLGGGQARQGGGAELDDVVGLDPEPEVRQQVGVIADQAGVLAQKRADQTPILGDGVAWSGFWQFLRLAHG